MIFTVGLKRICDISFYFTFAAFLVVSLGGDNLISVLPIFAVIAFLSAYLAKYGKVRFVSLLPLGLLYFVVPLTLVNMVGIVPAIVYTIINLPKPEEEVNQFEYVDVFILFIKLFAGLILLVLLFGAVPLFEDGSLLFSLSFFINTIILMRMIRHDKAVLKQTQFKIMNAMSLVTVIVGVILLSTDLFWTLLQNVVAWIWSNVVLTILRPILEMILSIFISVLTFIFDLFRLNPSFEIEFPELLGSDGEMMDDLIGEMGSGSWFNPLPIIAAVIVIAVFYMIFKALSRKVVTHMSSDAVEEERIMLDEGKRKKKRRFVRVNPIRDIYRKMLQKLIQRGVEIPNHFTSCDVEKLIGATVKSDKANKLREAYIPVRYGEAGYTKEDIKMVKALYKEILKELDARQQGE